MKRTLSLRREALGALGADDLAAVAGGQLYTNFVSCPLAVCVRALVDDVETLPIEYCVVLPTVPPRCNSLPC